MKYGFIPLLLLCLAIGSDALGVTPSGALVAAVSEEEAERTAWAVTPADADGPDGRGGFEYVAERGGMVEDFVAVRNLGHDEIQVRLSVQDAVQTLDNDFGMAEDSDGPARLASWVDLDTSFVTVPARSSLVIPVFIQVPEDAEPGDYAGGILAVHEVTFEDAPAVHYQVGTRIYLRVAGPVTAELDIVPAAQHHGRIGPFSLGSADIDATVTNTGNVRVDPLVRARVSSLFNWWEATVPLDNVPELLPDGSAETTGRLNGVPALGPLWVTTEVTHAVSGNQNVTDMVQVSSETTVVWAVPWVLLGAITFLLIALIVALRNLRKRRVLERADAVRASAEAASVPDALVEPASSHSLTSQ